MAFVLDASLTLAWCFKDESTAYSRQVLALLSSTHAEVPPLWTYEVANVLAMSERRQRITNLGSEEFLEALSALDIRIDGNTPSIIGKALLPLARRYGLTAYDAAYLEVAKRKVLSLATLDKDLIAATPQEGIELIVFQPDPGEAQPATGI